MRAARQGWHAPGLALGLLLAAAAPAAASVVGVATLKGTVNPASADYLKRAIARSAEEGDAALVIELDTPGGLVAATKDIIQAILNARIPVVVYVAPRGAWAGSAGTFITLAAHVAAMAPGTTIGAAHPVSVGGGGGKGQEGGEDVAAQKAENMLAAFIESIAKERHRNVEWAIQAVRQSVAIPADEALAKNVIDLIAKDRTDLLRKLDGRVVAVVGGERKLAVADASIREIPMRPFTQLLHVLANPSLATMLLLAGFLGLYVEFNHPGLVLPGVAGAICLILAFIALQILPFSWLGLLLFVGGLVLLAAEVFVSSFGLLFALGIACALLGGSMLFDLPEFTGLELPFWRLLVPAVGALAAFVALAAFAVGRSFARRQSAGVDELLGMVGRATTALDPEGTVFVRGEYWRARAEEPVAQGERVEIVAVEGLRLRVRRAPPEG